ncbi:hypothetical protein RIF29_21551 [Crotalaria pallida]|uniref:Uncharacterized protein n=1 Tax=Crotalaria pallida TaxID=3830 RepID=A0AAN9F363_CROPI
MHVPLRRVYSELSKGFNLDVDLNIRSLLGFEVESEHAETTTLTGIECFDDEDGEVRSGDDDERERESGEVRRSDDAEREREGGEGRSDAERDLFGSDILNIFKKIVEGTGRRIKLPNK